MALCPLPSVCEYFQLLSRSRDETHWALRYLMPCINTLVESGGLENRGLIFLPALKS